MFLTKLLILNNKSCRNIGLVPSKTQPEVMIGINDCGKSTILKSLDIFFDEKKNLSFLREDQQKSDLSNSPLSVEDFNQILVNNSYPPFLEYKGDVIGILCEFELEVSDMFNTEFQDNAKNLHLKWAIGDSNKIVMLRIFNNEAEIERNVNGYYLLTKDYRKDDIFTKAWDKNKTDLKKIRENLGVKNEDVMNENNSGPFKNIEEIRAIYKKVESGLTESWFKYKDFPKDKLFFPSFKYLNWDFSLQDLEDIATEAMNEVTNPLLQEIKDLASIKQNEAITGVNQKFEELMGDLKDELPENIKKISSSVFFNVSQKITDIQLQKENVDGQVHIDNQGDGIKRQIWFALLKWRSKLTSGQNTRNRYIWCFDEPETHLYPAAQRQLYNTFRDMCANEFQILLSTHSTVFIDRTKISEVNQVILDAGYSTIYKSTSVEDLFSCLGVKNSDFLFFDKFLAVEGYTEYELIPELYKLKYGRSLFEDGIQLINLKGKDQSKNNKQILDDILTDFQKTNNKTFYLFDSDTGVLGDNIFVSGTYDLEDSISNEVWIRFVKDNCEINITEDFLDKKIRMKMENSRNKKFYKLLSDYVAENVKHGKYLPTKGYDSGYLLAKCFKDPNNIPLQIDNLFDKLNS